MFIEKHAVTLFSPVGTICLCYNLRRGQVGTVVEILSNDDAYEVEFSDRDGRTYQSLGFRAPQLMVLHHAPVQNPSNPISE